jgi:outer membrane cobalamin receptor
MRYEISEKSTLRASVGRFFQIQGIGELQVSDGETGFFAPQRADHIVLGLDRRLATGATLRIEAYTKRMSDLRPRFENLLNSRVLLPELKPDRIRVHPDAAEARGLEVSLHGQSDTIQWWSSFGWARVEDDLAGANVLRSWDQTYTLNAGLLWTRDLWSFSAGAVYRSGWPTTPVSLNEAATFPTANVALRNSDRMRAYGSVDVRLSREIRLERSDLNVFIELTNFLDRSNPCCIEYEIGDEDDLGLLVLDEQAYLPTIPSIGFTWTF